MREITQSGGNPPIMVYDTSGPYTDPDARIDIRKGLSALREQWISARADTELLSGPTSEYGRRRLADPKLAELRFDLHRKPRRGKCVTQMHYARRGIVTPEMEFIALRENQRLIDSLSFQHPGESFGARLPRHADRAGRAGRRLLHDPRRRAPALHSAHREAHDRHRLARRLDHGEMVPGAPRGELPLHALRGNLRDHGRLRRLVLARRWPAARLDLRRER